MDALVQDLRSALRSIRRNRGVALAALATLALGIGGTCAMFGVIDLSLLRPLPFAREDQLLRLREGIVQPDGRVDAVNVSGAHFLALQRQAATLAGLTAQRLATGALTRGDVPEHVQVVALSPRSLEVLGVRLLTGRGFNAREEELGLDGDAALIGDALARKDFGGAAGAVGQAMTLDGRTRRIAGVLPAGYRFPYDAEVWLPAVVPAEGPQDYAVFARLAPGVSLAQARAELLAISRRMPELVPGTLTGYRIEAVPLRASLIGGEDRVAFALLGVLGAFLLLACANVATLLLARSTARSKELAVRAALGATRGRLLRQLFSETVLLAIAAGAAALLLLLFAAPWLMTLVPGNLSGQLGLSRIEIDPRVLGFTLCASLLAAVAAGVAPALHASRADLAVVLRDGGGTGRSPAAQRPLRALVVGQIALAFTLLTGAGLIIQDFHLLSRGEVGFLPRGLVRARIELPTDRYPDGARRRAFAERIQAAAAELRGVEAVGVTSVDPLSGATWSAPALALGQEESATQDVNHRLITPGLLHAMRIPLLRGRDVSSQDAAGAERVVLVSRHLARRLWPGEEAIGKRIRSARRGAPWMTVVGVVGDVRDQGDLADAWYLPWAQNADSSAAASVQVMLRSSQEAGVLGAQLRRQVASIDGLLPVIETDAMDAVREKSLSRERLGANAVALFAAFGLLLAALGTYGVISFTMAQRTAEIGLRLALGATRKGILQMVLRQGMLLALGGVGAGFVTALALQGLLRARLVEVQGAHPLLFAGVAVVLVGVALGAAVLPARRATAIEPVEALRAG